MLVSGATAQPAKSNDGCTAQGEKIKHVFTAGRFTFSSFERHENVDARTMRFGGSKKRAREGCTNIPHTFCWRPGNGERVRMHVLLPKLTVNHDRRCRRYNSPSQHQHPSHSLHVFACRTPAVGLSQAHRGRIFQTYRDRVDSVRDNVARTGTSPGKCCTSTGS